VVPVAASVKTKLGRGGTGEDIDILQALNRDQGVTVICSTHDPKMLTASARVCWIEDGLIKKVTSPDEVDLHK